MKTKYIKPKMVINSVNLPLEICSISGGGDVNANYGGVDTGGTKDPAIKQREILYGEDFGRSDFSHALWK